MGVDPPFVCLVSRGHVTSSIVAGGLPHACSDHPPSSMLFFHAPSSYSLPSLQVIYECNMRATVNGGRAPNGTPLAV